MRLYEYQGKELLRKYGISCPRGEFLESPRNKIGVQFPVVLKSQVLSGGRGKKGAVQFAAHAAEFREKFKSVSNIVISGEKPIGVLVEEKVHGREYYMSLSYSSDSRTPVLALSPRGGVDINKASIFSVNLVHGLPAFAVRYALKKAGFPKDDWSGLVDVVQKAWSLFLQEHTLLLEINPLFRTAVGAFVAGDAKIILDDEKLNPGLRRFLHLGGDIAVLASGGGASLVNIDALLHFGGKPANYTEYSGNPPASIVAELTKKVLQQQNLKGCWVVGGTANFTDIFETLKGFVEGLREVWPKPSYPIVIRRDGPRQKEAFDMLKNVAREEGYRFHLYGSETPMVESARIMVRLAYKDK